MSGGVAASAGDAPRGGWASVSGGRALHWFPAGGGMSACRKAVLLDAGVRLVGDPGPKARRCARCRKCAVVARSGGRA